MTFVRSGAGAEPGETGVQSEGLLFYVDAGNRTSYLGSGTTWTDLIASATATLTSVTVTDGYLNFNATTSIANFGTLSASNENLFDGGGTVCAWVRANGSGESGLGRVVTTEGTSVGGWFVATNGASATHIDITFEQRFTTNNGRWSFTTLAAPLSEWIHVAVVYDNGSAANSPTLYLNGVAQVIEANNTPAGTRESDSGESLVVGNNPATDGTFDGDINAIFLYSQGFTEAEVLRHYNATNKYLRPDLVGHPSSNASGEDLIIRGGDTSATAVSASGGDVTIGGGITGSTALSGTAHGGDIFILGGTTDTGGVGVADGGDITIAAATPDSDGDGGVVAISAGNGGTGGGNTQGGGVTITGGDGAVSAQGGGVTITGGQSLGAVVTGGPITVTGGENLTASGAGGVITLTGGTGQRFGGDVTIKGGTKNAAGGGGGFTSGDILIESGDIGGTSGYDFGNITIQVPDPVTPSAHNVLGGSITIKAGTTGTRNADGGDVSITAGDTFGFNTRIGGTITLTAGDENNGTSGSQGGSVVMVPGTSVSGTDGRVKIQGTGTLEFTERTTALSIAAGVGYVWVRNDAPNALVFTDDAGNNISISCASGLQCAASATVIRAANGSSSAGQDATFGGGAGDTGFAGGDVNLEPGAGSSAADGNVVISRGNVIHTSPTFTDVTRTDSISVSEYSILIAPVTSGAGKDLRLTSGDTSAASQNGGNLILEAGDEGAGGTRGIMELRTNTIEPQPATAIEFVLILPSVGSGDGNDFRIKAADTSAASQDGGNLILEVGDQGAGGTRGIMELRTNTIEPQPATAIEFALILPSVGSGDGNDFRIKAAPTTAASQDGGNLILGLAAGGAGGTDGALVIENSAGTRQLNIEIISNNIANAGSNGPSATDAGTGISLTGGDGNTSGAGGSLLLEAGASPSGTNGSVTVTTAGTDGPIGFRTTSGFTGTTVEKLSSGSQDTVASGAGTADVVTLGTLDTNGQNMKFDVWVTIVDDAVDTNVLSARIQQSAYRASGTVNLITAHQNDEQGNGGVFLADLAFTLVVSSNDVLLRVTNTSSTVTYTINTAVSWERQEGGFST